MKGIDIVVGGSVGHMSAFMAQRGNLVVCGDAGEALGDSIYEARLYVKGKVANLGADCIEKDMRALAGIAHQPEERPPLELPAHAASGAASLNGLAVTVMGVFNIPSDSLRLVQTMLAGLLPRYERVQR